MLGGQAVTQKDGQWKRKDPNISSVHRAQPPPPRRRKAAASSPHVPFTSSLAHPSLSRIRWFMRRIGEGKGRGGRITLILISGLQIAVKICHWAVRMKAWYVVWLKWSHHHISLRQQSFLEVNMACFYFVVYFATDISIYSFLGDCVAFTSDHPQVQPNKKVLKNQSGFPSSPSNTTVLTTRRNEAHHQFIWKHQRYGKK